MTPPAGGQRPPGRQPAGPGPRPPRREDDSLLRGGLTGIALVTAATVGLATVAALIALVIALLYG